MVQENIALWMKIIDDNLKHYNLNIQKIMDKAGKAVADVVTKKYGAGKHILIVCGKGNNGGDGFAAASFLAAKNKVTVALLGKPADIHTRESRYYWKHLPNAVEKRVVTNEEDLQKILKNQKVEVIIDSILGLGAKGKPRGFVKDVVTLFNETKAKKVAIDMPSPGCKVDVIVSFHLKKHPRAIVKDIGIPHKLDCLTGSGNIKILRQRKPDSHKGDNGRVLVIAGSKQYHGAAFFAGLAASKFVDLVYLATVEENRPIAKKYSLEFVVLPLEGSIPKIKKVDACIIGPGLEVNEKNKILVERLLKNKKKKFVLDASIFHLISPDKVHKNCCITPHAREFQVFFKRKATEKNVKAMAKKYGCLIVLKRKTDLITDGRELWKNTSGNAGMTTGGTGDILAGVIGGFAAKNDLLLAALAGCFLTGFTGDMLYKRAGFSYNATTLLKSLSKTYKQALEC